MEEIKTKFKNAVVLTGSIATGKSSVAKIVKSLGYEIVDADMISHGVLDGKIRAIIDLFGERFVKENKVDRKALGELVFNDKDKLSLLEELLHPAIKEQIYKKAEELDKNGELFFVEIPLFFESGDYFDLGMVAVVYVPEEIQLQRLMKRNNLDLETAKKRANLQLSIEKKKSLADYIIDNSGSLEALKDEVLDLIKRLNLKR